MRIIAGVHRGRTIEAPEGLTTRPMTDRVRENLFNSLGQDLTGAVVLDLFCGSGALGLEALSRGAVTATFVDADRDAVAVAESNCLRLGLTERARILRCDALKPGPWLRPSNASGATAYTLVFCDPPYALTADARGQERLAEMAAALAHLKRLAPGAVVMLRAERGKTVALPWPGFAMADERTYGTTTLFFMTYCGQVGSEGTA
jgi:16S rRNA (guanine966-N2)-methyltransferase